jgi:hypothetical protein
MTDDELYAEGMAAGTAQAETEPGPLPTTPVITGKPAIWVAGYRVGRAKTRNARHLARTEAEATGLFTWAHSDPALSDPCPGRFEYLERLPAATVYACPTCGQHRVQQDDPAAHSALMAGLADALLDAADRT